MSAQSEHKSKLEEALARVAAKRAQAQTARPANDPTPPRAHTMRTTPRDLPPSVPAIGLPQGKVLLGLADLRALGISWSRQHLHRLMRESRFPPQVASGPEPSARKFWKAGDIAAWLAALPYAAEPGEAAE